MKTNTSNVCENCGKIYYRKKRCAESVWRVSRFCTYECFRKWNVGPNNGHWIPRPDIFCKDCGAKIECRGRPRVSYLIRQFCDACRWNSRTGSRNVNWKGGRCVTKVGYTSIRIAPNKRRAEHSEIAEKALGRKLKRGELVHHINMDKSDNRPENLLICSQEYHRYLHWAMEKAWIKEHILNRIDDTRLFGGCLSVAA